MPPRPHHPRPRARAAAALSVAALLLAACSDPGAGTTSTGSVAWPESTADLTGRTITIWAAQNSTDIPSRVVTDFEAATGATVDVVTVPDPYEQGVQTKVASGDVPDLAFWQPTASQLTALNATSTLVPIDDAPFLDRYTDDLRDVTGTLDGTRYAALVTAPSVIGVWYNKKVFAEYGITELPSGFDELVATARTIAAAGGTPFSEMGKDRWATQWWVQVQVAEAAQGGLWDRVNAHEETFADETLLTAISTYQDLVDEGLFNDDLLSTTFEDQGADVLAGDAAMALQVNTFFNQLQAKADTAELDETIGFFPVSETGTVATVIPDQSNAVVMFRSTDERESAAKQFLRFWMEDDYAAFVEDRATVSVQTDVATPDGVPQALLDNAASISDSVGSMQVLAVVNPDLYLNLATMLAGQATPLEAAGTTQAQFEQLAQAVGVDGF